MKYEYKVVTLCEADTYLGSSDFAKLNKFFSEGWEYVEIYA